MKTRILVIVLCLACISSYAQRTRKPKNTKAAATQQPVQQQPQQPAGGVNPNSTTSAKPTGTDTTKKGPAKAFEHPLDGYFKKNNILSAKVTPYPNLRESDAAFVKRVWREIDVREKMNQYLASPKQRLIDVLLTAIEAEKQKINIHYTAVEEFPISIDEAKSLNYPELL